MVESPSPAPKRRLIWPWLLAGAVLLAIVIAALAIRAEADRVRQIRQFQDAPANR